MKNRHPFLLKEFRDRFVIVFKNIKGKTILNFDLKEFYLLFWYANLIKVNLNKLILNFQKQQLN